MKKFLSVLLLSLTALPETVSAVTARGQGCLERTFISPVRIVWQKDSSLVDRADLLLREGIGHDIAR